jgi:hypothetical protein
MKTNEEKLQMNLSYTLINDFLSKKQTWISLPLLFKYSTQSTIPVDMVLKKHFLICNYTFMRLEFKSF